MFKIEKAEYVNRTFRIEKNLLEDLSRIAANSNVSLNSLFNQCCRYALKDLEQQSPKE